MSDAQVAPTPTAAPMPHTMPGDFPMATVEPVGIAAGLSHLNGHTGPNGTPDGLNGESEAVASPTANRSSARGLTRDDLQAMREQEMARQLKADMARQAKLAKLAGSGVEPGKTKRWRRRQRNLGLMPTCSDTSSPHDSQREAHLVCL